jgi:dCMP deaminase
VAINLMREVYKHAASYSGDPSTRNAAFIVRDNKVVAYGANKFPRGVLTSITQVEFRDRGRKLVFIEHAERAAIYDAAKMGVPTYKATMVCPWACCAECARAIAMSGIAEVIVHKQALDKTPERWWLAIEDGQRILSSAGVEFTQLDARIGGVENLFNGEVWYP